MKPSNICANIKMRTAAISGASSRGAGQVSTLYLAAAGGLLVALLATCEPSAATPSAASKSGRPASDQLALPSTTSTASKRLAPVSHRETTSSVSSSTSTRATDLSVGQSNIAHAKVHTGAQDMQTAAGHHYGKGHGKYYMYAESPKRGAYKAGFKRGNHKHTIERKEWQHKSHAGGHMKWHDKKGKGSHKWELKHYDKKGKHYG